ncbi:MAG TPA: hypothetical protein VK809_13300 [Bacteroidia bacterium]|jgi:hypothetical protein|nr:hypothetical protein [Bacteroidia bacterium]
MPVKENKKQNKIKPSIKWFLPLSVILICISSFSLYHSSTDNDYLDLDDMTILVKNYPFLKNISNAPKAFTQGVFQEEGQKDTLASYYRPVMIFSFMLDAQLSPSTAEYPKPKPFLKANIFYHTVACILLLLLLFQLNIPPLPSLLLTLIFTVHPLLNQAVAWIPGRNDSLLSIFILLSFLSLFKYKKTQKNGAFILHILFFALALFTKENAIMCIPVAFMLIRFIFKEPFNAAIYKKLGISYLSLVIVWLLLRQHALALNISSGSWSDLFHNFIHNLPCFIQYFGKAILPFNLSVMSMVEDTNYILGLLAIVIVGGSLFLSKQSSKPLVWFGFTWFILFLLPSFFSGFSGLEHRAYLPLMGLIITCAQIDWIKNAAIKPIKVESLGGTVILVVVIIIFYSLSAKRLPIFHDRFSFNKSAMETSPKLVLPCLYLGQHYDEIGDFKDALDAYREALKRDSNSFMTHSNIAGDYIHMNMYPEAEKELRIEIAKHPTNNIAVFNLGLVVFQGDTNYTEGVRLWKKAVSMDSGFAQPYKVLFQYYQATGDSTNTILYRNLYYRKKR